MENQKCEWSILSSLSQIEKFIIRYWRLLAEINLIMKVNFETSSDINEFKYESDIYIVNVEEFHLFH